jgi:ABC-type dipeptide/oligopeptide/nickel transport system permease component
MTGFVIRRVFQALLVTFLVTAFTLLLVDLFPGGPVHTLLGPRATQQQIAYYNQLWGFDQPFYRQYLTWAGQLLHGNLGYSISRNQPASRTGSPAWRAAEAASRASISRAAVSLAHCCCAGSKSYRPLRSLSR